MLKLFVISAAAGLGCRDSTEPEPEPEPEFDDAEILAVYPQGIASGDPTATSVILWTRVEPEPGTEAEDIMLSFEVARDEAMTELVATGELTVSPDADHTVHIKLTDLEPASSYHYRFRARGVPSWIGRTRTAPLPDAEVPVRFAAACCQDYVARHLHAYRELASLEDAGRPIDFVLFLGDYVYEYETGSDTSFMARDTERIVLPDGLEVKPGVLAAVSLADYRTLYRIYKSDPDLREAHRRHPFVITWDDHEFANDCWQDYANDFDGLAGEEQSTTRRERATQAWFEYSPVDLEYLQATGFPGDIRVYRALRWGAHVELFATDQRYYRSDHVVPEGPADPEVGKILENSPLGSRVLAIKSVFDEREAAAAPTMLGAEQLAWLIAGLTGSTASWKLWGSQALVAQMALDLTEFENLPDAFRQLFYFKLDHWDGYRSERAQILAAVADTPDVVVISGDIHGFYASRLYVDFDADPGAGIEPAAIEFTGSAISSSSLQEQVDTIVASQPLLTPLFGDLVAMFDDNLRSTNGHFEHVDSSGLGIMIVEADADELRAELIAVSDVFDPDPSSVTRRRFALARGSKLIESRD